MSLVTLFNSLLAITAVQFLAKVSFDPIYGARPVAENNEYVKSKMVDEFLFGKLKNGGSVHLDIESGTTKLDFGERSTATAKTKVQV